MHYGAENEMKDAGDEMKYSELASGKFESTQVREYLVAGDTTAITIRIPEHLKTIAAEKASLNGLSFSAYVRTCLLSDLLSFERHSDR